MNLVAEKVRQAVALLNDLEITCWLTFVRETELNRDPMLDYVLGAHVTWPSAFIICRSGETIAIVGQGDRQSVDDIGVYRQVIGYVKDFKTDLTRVLRTLQPARIALNYSTGSEISDGLTHGMFLTLQDVLADAGCAGRIESAEALVAKLRGRKSAWEVASIRKAIGVAIETFATVGATLRPGMSEQVIAGAMQSYAARRGCDLAWSADTCPGVFAGPDVRDLHARPGERVLAEGQLVYVDFGVRCEGYCSDLQRVYFVTGSQVTVPADVQRGFDVLVESIERARQAMRPGALGVDVDAACRQFLVSQGYGEFPHALGHQVGRFAHDGSALLAPAWEKYMRKPFEPLEEGMVFTIEPRLQVAGRGTVSIEEMVLVTASGAEFLSPPQKTLLLVPSDAGR